MRADVPARMRTPETWPQEPLTFRLAPSSYAPAMKLPAPEPVAI